ncbi:hypothetical protein O9G_005922 [Rozella allomycis CSF55]|uniref:Uncharacterized protein n=1 Tax=Rozella allomycis (strain CSF55) TaxID=988480 RepID=A0A075B1E6_ROZAC|nr:hypothetical protein O9G_005922 [Rozella allomycis CSF55]|eukprot:EPZ36368.1 hypothetical protein O9G_005922 [Rozella allomycis CSF55]
MHLLNRLTKMRDGKQRAQGEQFDYEASMFYTLFMDNPNNASTSDKNVLNESKSHFGASRGEASLSC